MDELVVAVKHLLDELNVNNDVCCRTDHLFQAEDRQGLCDILNEYINNDFAAAAWREGNDGGDGPWFVCEFLGEWRAMCMEHFI